MRRLLPDPGDEIDLYEAYRPDAETSLRLNMVLSADGRATDREGRTGLLGGAGDKAVFRVVRAHADGILVGANTVRAEGYGPHRLSDELRARRTADGRPLPAPIVVVSGTGELDLDSPLFVEAESPTIVVTTQRCPEATREAIQSRGVLVLAGEDQVDLARVVALLRARFDMGQLLCEGGPTLNGQLVDAGLVDELCLTLAPTLVGTAQPNGIVGLTAAARQLTLVQVLAERDGGELYLRYRLG